MATATHTTGEIPYPNYGIKTYRIELINDRYQPMQRHIWTYESGEIETNEWIRGSYEAPEKLAAQNWKEVS